METKAELNRLEALRRVMAERSYRLLCKGALNRFFVSKLTFRSAKNNLTSYFFHVSCPGNKDPNTTRYVLVPCFPPISPVMLEKKSLICVTFYDLTIAQLCLYKGC